MARRVVSFSVTPASRHVVRGEPGEGAAEASRRSGSWDRRRRGSRRWSRVRGCGRPPARRRAGGDARPQQDAVDQAEDAGVHADAEGEHQDRGEREAPMPREYAEAETNVLPECVHHWPSLSDVCYYAGRGRQVAGRPSRCLPVRLLDRFDRPAHRRHEHVGHAGERRRRRRWSAAASIGSSAAESSCGHAAAGQMNEVGQALAESPHGARGERASARSRRSTAAATGWGRAAVERGVDGPQARRRRRHTRRRSRGVVERAPHRGRPARRPWLRAAALRLRDRSFHHLGRARAGRGAGGSSRCSPADRASPRPPIRCGPAGRTALIDLPLRLRQPLDALIDAQLAAACRSRRPAP